MHKIILLLGIMLIHSAVHSSSLISVRMGKHEHLTRLVLDFKGSVKVNKNNLMLYNTNVPAQYIGEHKGVGQIESYCIDQVGGNARLSVRPVHGAVVRKVFGLTSPARLVLDIGPANTNQVQIKFAPSLEKIIHHRSHIPTPQSKPFFKVVVLDPGHGGQDPGSVRNGVREKYIVSDIAAEIKAMILAQKLPYFVLLTRDKDTYVPLRQRFEQARKMSADLFVSLHADSHSDSTISGMTVYTLSANASDAEAEKLAKKENKSDVVAGIDLQDASLDVANIIIGLTQRVTQARSEDFARIFLAHIPRRKHGSSKPHRFANFAVLKAADVPSVLIEVGYLSNRKDRHLLQQKNYQKKVSFSIVSSMEKYFNSQTREQDH